ncbi:MAG: hypothetical protein HYR84_06475 [Planctomycetes bacterium]|nr:hypothetical protein [Planctomycetota bacterium]
MTSAVYATSNAARGNCSTGVSAGAFEMKYFTLTVARLHATINQQGDRLN